jgi:NADP-dependent 3-hydroxy acid dehydrogenase YdfG
MKWITKICMSLLMVAAFHVSAEQKVVVVSGATGGIGKATIKAFEQKGWKVLAGYRPSTTKCPEDTANIHWIALDVTDDHMVEQTIQTIIEKEGKIDALVNNAGYGVIGLEEMVSMEETKKLFEVNFFGALKLIQHVVPHMQSRRSGHIINISSTSGVRAVPGLGIYAASKFALEGLSEGLAVTLTPWNIQVAIVEPGTVKNDFAKHCFMSQLSKEHPFAERFCQNLMDKLISLAASGQECEEIGQLIVKVAESTKPNLRYQTSSKVEDTVAKKFVDLTGNTMREEQLFFFIPLAL